MREHQQEIKSGKEAMQLKGIGKFIAQKIDEALIEARRNELVPDSIENNEEDVEEAGEQHPHMYL